MVPIRVLDLRVWSGQIGLCGLVPIRADPRLFDDFAPDDEATDLNTIVFKLDVSCNAGEEGSTGEWRVGEDGSRSFSAHSGRLEWQPQGEQAEKFAGKW